MALHVIEQRRRDLGGFEVGRVLPYGGGRMVGPFIFFDHLGPADFPKGLPRTVDVRPHPHIGLATVTYLFDGEIMHRDSVASEQAIDPGAINWMIAGRGITHSERFEKARALGDKIHGIQSWVALPADQEERAPAFAHHPPSQLPMIEEPGVSARLLVGELWGKRAAVETLSPIFYVHATLAAAANIAIPRDYSERAAYIVSGEIECDGRKYRPGQMLIFDATSDATLRAATPAVLMLLGGEPLGERFIEWNFVSSSRERIEQAKADWRAGRIKLPDFDNGEFIPLPGAA